MWSHSLGGVSPGNLRLLLLASGFLEKAGNQLLSIKFVKNSEMGGRGEGGGDPNLCPSV